MGRPFAVLIAVGFSAACVMTPPPDGTTSGGSAHADSDGGVEQAPPTADGGATPATDAGTTPTADAGTGGIVPPTVDGGSLALDPAVALPPPPAPAMDDPAVCAVPVIPAPDVPTADRPCTVTYGVGPPSTVYRYDPSGRVIYLAIHTDTYDSLFTSEDDGGVRTETFVAQGNLVTKDIIQLIDGKPVEADHFRPSDAGGLVLNGHTTWLYDDHGRQQYVISQYAGQARLVERTVYDQNGRPYFVDNSVYWPGFTNLANHSYTLRSYFANGTLLHEYWTCDIEGGAPCGALEKRWESCGNLSYSGDQTGNLRNSSFIDWTWDSSGRPATRHNRWNQTGGYISSTETFQLDSEGRAISGTILTTYPPEAYLPATEQHQASYTYDSAGYVIERVLDGKTDFQASYDANGRVTELTRGSLTLRWTYDGCGR